MSKLMTQAEHDARYAVPDAAARTIMRPEDIAAADARAAIVDPPCCRDIAEGALARLIEARDKLRIVIGLGNEKDPQPDLASNGNLDELYAKLIDISTIAMELQSISLQFIEKI